MRRNKTAKEFIELLAECSSEKEAAETAADFFKRHLSVSTCAVLMPRRAVGKTAYGDKLSFMAALTLPEKGKELVLPATAIDAGWAHLELKTAIGRAGWVLFRPVRGFRRAPFQACVGALAFALQAMSGRRRLKEVMGTHQSELEVAIRQLDYTNAKLKSLDETKDEFISMASHQLRTPLTSVKGYLSMVLDGDAGDISEQQRKLLYQAFSSSQRMNYLITDLLNVSRLRTGRFVIEKVPVSLPDLIEDEMSQLSELARAKNISLEYDKPAAFPALQLDETKTRQVIMNFIDNALHYTPEGGKVRVELEERPRSIEFRVVDNGLGVPRREQHKLFNKFFRANNARRVRPDGTGLGLFMAKKVIIAQGGAIVFKSLEGKGSTFGFTFPRLKSQGSSTKNEES